MEAPIAVFTTACPLSEQTKWMVHVQKCLVPVVRCGVLQVNLLHRPYHRRQGGAHGIR